MKLIVAVTGASGVIYGQNLIQELEKDHDLFVIVSEAAKKVIEYELGGQLKFNSEIHKEDEIDASIASGTHDYQAMVVIPCSMKTLSSIANAYSDNLISRAAGVMLKQKRKLILVPRETPLSSIHLENMLKLSKLPKTHIIPACPGFYNNPESKEDIINFTLGKVMDILKLDHNFYKKWKNVKEGK